MKRLLFDTCFLIDLERERLRGAGPARALLAARAGDVPCINWVVAGEFGEGFDDPADPRCAALLDAFERLPADPETVRCYARLARQLRASGRLIGANDLWIAASALAHDLPLVTRNLEHFGRIPGLALVGY